MLVTTRMQSQSLPTQNQSENINHFHQKTKNKKSFNYREFIEAMSEYFVDNVAICVHDDYIDDTSELSSQGKIRKWTIKSNDLKTVPPFYPLDRTFKVIQNTTAEVLSERLTKCIKVFNLATNWDDENPTRLCCSTNNFLKFEINLWKQEKEHSENEEATQENKDGSDFIIEIRRHDGDCVRFHRLRKALLSILLNPNECNKLQEGLKQHNNVHVSRAIYCNSVTPHLRPLALDNLMDVLNSVVTAYELIFNENDSDTLMGLKTLIFLTDSTSIHRVYAAHVSDFILLGYDVLGNSVPAVRDVIYNFVVNQRNSIEHHYALQILTNSFQNSSLQQEVLTDSQIEIDLWNDIIPSLILDMKSAEQSPHIAYNAVKCIRSWYSLAGVKADQSYKNQILSCLEKVTTFGEQCYASLAIESNHLKLTIA